MPLALDQFLKSLGASGAIDALEVESLRSQVSADVTSEAVAQRLVQEGKLTRFQAQQVLGGRGAALQMNQYVLLDKIGAGGMGQVFKAQHRKMKRIVAIKLLPPALTKDADALRRFEREVEAAAKLSHPNIVQAHDADECRGVHYLVMELVEGHDLSAIVKSRGPLPVDEAVNYIFQAACGLAFAHSKGVVHRDIKPANLLVDGEGNVKILDMGLARFDDADGINNKAAQQGLTQTGQVMGTVDYMAPEQAADTHAADHRSDIYSLGCSLYRLITGENAYAGDTVVKKILAHLTDPIPALSVKRPDVPPAIDAIFQKMVAKRPEQRYQKTVELVADLQAVRGGSATLPSGMSEHSDNQLTRFLSSMSGAAIGPTTSRDEGVTAALGNAPLRSVGGIDVTASFRGSEMDTDPKSQIVGRIQKEEGSPGERRGVSPPRRRNRNMIIAGGAAAFFLLLALGVWIVIRDKDGNEVARVEAGKGTKVVPPPGGTVEVVTEPDKPGGMKTNREEGGAQPSVGGRGASSADGTFAGAPLSQTDVLTSPNWIWSEPKKLRTGVNQPCISGDGLSLVYISSGEGSLGANDLWIAERRNLDESFGKAANLGPNVNSDADESEPWISSDGSTLLFASARPGGVGGSDLWLAIRKSKDEPFGRAMPLGAPVNSTYGEYGGAISADGLNLVFRSSRSGGAGGSDIWQSRRKDLKSPFSKPENLGPAVNSDLEELRPWLSSDGRVLLFGTVENVMDASGKKKRRAGSGTIWMATRPSVDAPFAPRQKLPAPINADGSDNTFPSATADGKQLYFVSKRGDVTSDYVLWTSQRVSKGSGQTAESGGQTESSPLDALDRSNISSEQWKNAGLDPAKAPVELVALFGTTNEATGWNGSLKMAPRPHDNALAFVSGSRTRINFANLSTGKSGGNATPSSAITALAYSPDGKMLATGDNGNAVKLWSLTPPTVEATLAGHSQPPKAVVFSPDGRTLASADNHSVKFWDVTSRKLTSPIPEQTGTISALAYSPDSRLLAVVGHDSTFKLWDVAKAREHSVTMKVTTGNFTSACFSPDGQTFFAATSNGSIRAWNLATGEKRDIAYMKGTNIMVIAVRHDGRVLASGGSDGAVRFWDLSADTLNAEPKPWQLGPPDGKIYNVAFDATGRYLFTGNGNQTVYVLRLDASSVPLETSSSPKSGPDERAASATAALSSNATSPFDSLKRSGIPADQLTRAGLGDPAKAPAELVAIAGATKENPWTSASSRIAINPGQRTFAITVGAAKVASFWSAESGKQIGTITDLPDRVQRLAYSPDGKLLAAAMGASDKTIKIFDLDNSRKEKFTLTGHTSGVWALAFSPDGKTLASGSSKDDTTVRLWDVATGKQRLVITREIPVPALAFSPDGKTLAITEESIRFYDAASTKEAGSAINTRGPMTAIVYSPDGRFLAGSSSGGLIRTWNLATGKLGVSAKIGELKINSIAYRPDGCVLAAACSDGSVRLIDTTSGSEVQKLQLGPPDGLIDELAYDATGSYLLTANGNQTIYVLRMDAGGGLETGVGSQGTAAASSLAPSPQTLAPPKITSQRELAEYILSKGGMVGVEAAGKTRNGITAAKDLPAGDLVLKQIAFQKSEAFSDNDIDLLHGLDALASLSVDGRITLAGIARIPPLPSLTFLSIGGPAVEPLDAAAVKALERLNNLAGFHSTGKLFSTGGLPKILTAWPKLTKLDLVQMGATDGTLAEIGKYKQIEWLSLQQSPAVTDAGIKSLSALNKLTYLNIYGELKLTDSALETLSRMTSLKKIIAYRTSFSLAAIDRFRKAMPTCEMSWADFQAAVRTIENKGTVTVVTLSGKRLENVTDVAKLPQETFGVESINLAGRSANEAIYYFAGLTQVRALNLSKSDIDVKALSSLLDTRQLATLRLDYTKVGDRAIDTLAEVKTLRSLDLRSTQFTAAGIAKLQKALPNCKIESDAK